MAQTIKLNESQLSDLIREVVLENVNELNMFQRGMNSLRGAFSGQDKNVLNAKQQEKEIEQQIEKSTDIVRRENQKIANLRRELRQYQNKAGIGDQSTNQMLQNDPFMTAQDHMDSMNRLNQAHREQMNDLNAQHAKEKKSLNARNAANVRWSRANKMRANELGQENSRLQSDLKGMNSNYGKLANRLGKARRANAELNGNQRMVSESKLNSIISKVIKECINNECK